MALKPNFCIAVNIRQYGLVCALFSLLPCNSMPVQADLQPIEAFFGPPYRVETVNGNHRRYNTVEAVVDAWWEGYRKSWGVDPYGPLSCDFDLTIFADGMFTRRFASMLLTGDCGGGNSVYGTSFCPSGYTHIGPATCGAHGSPSNEKNLGKPPCPVGNPLHPGTGNKYQKETDYLSPTGNLELTRHYNSRFLEAMPNPPEDHGLGMNWSMTYSRQLNVIGNTLRVVRDDGYTEYFTCATGSCLGSTDTRFHIRKDASGYLLSNRDSTELYDPDGKLQSIVDIKGNTQTLSYDVQGRLMQVAANTGESLVFEYDTVEQDRIKTVTDHTNRQWTYRYDSIGTEFTRNNLEFVDYPDGTTRQYHYNETADNSGADLPNALTGITDERGVRYATFEHDSENRVIASYHAGDADRVEIVYNTDGTHTVTNSKGQPSTYTTATRVGVSLITDISGPGCSTCGAGNSSFEYDPDTNELLSKTDNGITIKYGNYDANGNPGCKIEGVTAIDTSPGECDFDPVASPDARRIDYTYDTRYFSKIATMTKPSVFAGASKVTTYAYDDFGNRTAETIAGYTPSGTPVSRTTTWQYNGPLHQLSRIDGPRTDVSDITTYRYYPDDPVEGSNRARLKEIEDATGALTRSNIQYTPTGKVLAESRPNGLTLSYTYYPGNDRLETLTETGSGSTRTTRWAYLATGEAETITTAFGTPDATTLRFGYDDARRLTRITDGLGNYIEYTLDTESNRNAEKFYDATGVLRKRLTQTFDTYNRLDVSNQVNESVDYDFAPDGTLDRSIDGRGSVMDYDYDTLKRLVTSTQDLGNLDMQTVYAYDVADRLTSITDPNSNATSYAYDDLGNLLIQTSPDTGTTSYQYDDAGNRIQQVDAKGQVFTYSYDAINRLTSVAAPGAVDDISYTYDSCANGAGRLCSVVRDVTTVNYRYTPQGDVTGFEQARTTWPGYQQAVSNLDLSYDAAGRRKTFTYPSGISVTYHYDAAGQVSGVDLDAGGAVTTLMNNATYLPFGPLNGQSLGNGLGQAGWYDQAYRTWALGSATFYDVLYYDENGNAHTQYTPAGIHTHSYDALNRLDTSAGPYGSRDYDHDSNGNRTRLIDDSSTTTYGYLHTSNRLSAIGESSVSLDPNGNTTSLPGLTLTYSADNRLKTVSGVANYAYNGLGQRVQKRTRAAGPAGQFGYGPKRVFVYGPEGSLLAELGPTGQSTREYIHANGSLLAVIDHVPDSGEPILNGDMDLDGAISIEDLLEWYFNHYLNVLDPAFDLTGDGLMNQADFDAMISCALGGTCLAASYEMRIYYVHSDHLGTPHALSDEAGIKVWSAVYDPFGKATVDEDPDGNGTAVTFNLRFPGQYFDAETGLHYNYFRYYDPTTGRYLTSDPIGLISDLNTYAYVANNPVLWIDPFGLRTFTCKKPLDAIGGSGLRSGPDIPGNPLFHEFLCVKNGDAVTCGGQDRTGGPFSPGKPSDDKFVPQQCDEIAPDNDCLEQCLIDAFSAQRPFYGLTGPGTNCQEWAGYVLSRCKRQCDFTKNCGARGCNR